MLIPAGTLVLRVNLCVILSESFSLNPAAREVLAFIR